MVEPTYFCIATPEIMINKLKRTFTKFEITEAISFLVVWLFIFISPLFVYRDEKQWLGENVLTSWLFLFFLLLIFLLNIYYLIPKYLYQKRYLHYVLILIAFLPLLACLETNLSSHLNQPQTVAMPSMNKGMPLEFSNEMPAPEGFKRQLTANGSTQSSYWMHLLIMFLLTGSTAAYKTIFYWIQEEKTRKEMESKLKTNNSGDPDFILVKSDYKIVKILLDDILFVESANEYVKIFLATGEMIMTFMRLKNIEEELPKSKFLRVQRSFIVNLDKIKAVEKNKIHIEHKKIIPIGEQYKDGFQEYLGSRFVK